MPDPCIRVRVVDEMRDGEGDVGMEFQTGVTVMRLRAGATITHTMGLEMQHMIHGAHEWVIERERQHRATGRHRAGRRRRREAVEPAPLGPDHTMPLPMTPTDRHGRAYGPLRRP